MVSHSSARTENMAISEKIHIYFSNLIKSLVTNESLEELFSKPKKVIVSKLKENL